MGRGRVERVIRTRNSTVRSSNRSAWERFFVGENVPDAFDAFPNHEAIRIKSTSIRPALLSKVPLPLHDAMLVTVGDVEFALVKRDTVRALGTFDG